MPKVSFRMASASRESVFGVQTSTARKIIGQAHRGPVDHDAKQMLRTERKAQWAATAASRPSRGHRGVRQRKGGSCWTPTTLGRSTRCRPRCNCVGSGSAVRSRCGGRSDVGRCGSLAAFTSWTSRRMSAAPRPRSRSGCAADHLARLGGFRSVGVSVAGAGRSPQHVDRRGPSTPASTSERATFRSRTPGPPTHRDRRRRQPSNSSTSS